MLTSAPFINCLQALNVNEFRSFSFEKLHSTLATELGIVKSIPSATKILGTQSIDFW